MEKNYLETTKNNLILIISLIVVIVIVALLFGNSSQSKIPKITNNKPLVSKEEDVDQSTFEIREIKKDDKYANFDIKYPYFFYSGPDFNNEIKDFVETQIDAHSVTSRESWKARYETDVSDNKISEFPKNKEEKFYFYSDFEIIQSNSSYVSVILRYGGFSGGAHGYDNRVSFAYDIKNKTKITLANLFMNNEGYLNLLSDYSRGYFQEKLESRIEEIFTEDDSEEAIQEYISNSTIMIKNGTEPTKDNFSVFSFTKDKITIYFGQYQVGPYSEGMQELEIPR